MKPVRKTFLFLHAGPGLNCEAERQALGPLLQAHQLKFLFLDEPSALRPKGPIFSPKNAAQGIIDSAEKTLLGMEGKVSIIGLSFGAIVAEHLLSRYPEKVSELIAISPTPNLQNVFLKMMLMAETDFKKQGSPLEENIKSCRLRTRSFYDLACQEGLGLTQADPEFFSHYWQKPDVMLSWAGTLGLPEYGFDLVSQKAVYEEMRESNPFLEVTESETPLTLIYGKKDPVVDAVATTSIYQQKFKQIRTLFFEKSGHFPHLEESQQFLMLLNSNTTVI